MDGLVLGGMLAAAFVVGMVRQLRKESLGESEHDISKIMDEGKTEKVKGSEEWAQQQLDKVAKETDEESGNESDRRSSAEELFLRLLDSIGCQHETVDEGRAVNFRFEGGTFTAYPRRYNSFVEIHFPYFFDMESYDEARFVRLSCVVSEANLRHIAQVFHTERDGRVYVHCKQVIYLADGIPEVEEYLRALLRVAFDVRRFIHEKMNEEADYE